MQRSSRRARCRRRSHCWSITRKQRGRCGTVRTRTPVMVTREVADAVKRLVRIEHMFCKTLTSSDTSTHGSFVFMMLLYADGYLFCEEGILLLKMFVLYS
ncbi:hypothetical protein ACQ4PT_037767 [Festuca glaucescens]